jgi:hypothetical protein
MAQADAIDALQRSLTAATDIWAKDAGFTGDDKEDNKDNGADNRA